ncbi:MAG: lipase [Gemmatales bacterium]|nr:MAG: lipase [Gemmatales bacterium]
MRIWLSLALAAVVVVPAWGQNLTAEPQVEAYKKIGDVELKMYLFKPAGHQASDKRAAVVFFFGGGWRGGTPKQFFNQCRYLASRGMVAMSAEYRVHSRHQATVAQCVADAKSAIRWVRANADKLGIDPNRIASGGGSAGGHLAAAVALLPGFDEKGEDQSISSRPNAMILFNPAIDLRKEAFREDFRAQRYAELARRFGADAKALSPAAHIRPKLPPAIVFHGTADATIPFAQVEAFANAMKKAGNRCELKGYDGMGHGFFNYRANDTSNFVKTMRQADEFLVSLGYLKGKPTIEEFVGK